MHQFFVKEEQVGEREIVITGSDCNHIRNALRMKPGEKVRISSDRGTSYLAQLTSISSEQVAAEILEIDEEGTELPCRVTLFQGLPKGERMELLIQKATELGADRIVPVAMHNCVVRLDAAKAANRCRRWQAVAESAAKQSKRTHIPEVELPMSWEAAAARLGEMEAAFAAYENERGMEETRRCLGALRMGAQVGILIGPEGGFTKEEIGSLPEHVRRISLGKRILRTETAGPAFLAMIAFALEEATQESGK